MEVSNFGEEPQVLLRIDEELATNLTKQEEAVKVSDSLGKAAFGHGNRILPTYCFGLTKKSSNYITRKRPPTQNVCCVWLEN